MGVFLFYTWIYQRHVCLPHARGGVSVSVDVAIIPFESSPRPWGCFFVGKKAYAICVVFPTPVGVFPETAHLSQRTTSLPHARGGVSIFSCWSENRTSSSPRPWGCF
ncbi:conserved hypothetical protein [methanotrophic bacterial endosymbiont of Bathymodiolus sp.]|nr:conserved hypothetical protein [methanotrophic bacterial endosymbiont of Bathymodiolus sp.]